MRQALVVSLIMVLTAEYCSFLISSGDATLLPHESVFRVLKELERIGKDS